MDTRPPKDLPMLEEIGKGVYTPEPSKKLLAYWTARGARKDPVSRAAAKAARKARRKNRK